VSPWWVVDKWVAPLLFIITIAACLGHVAVAYSMSVHAKKTQRRHKNMRAGLLGGMSFRNDSAALSAAAGLPGFVGGNAAAAVAAARAEAAGVGTAGPGAAGPGPRSAAGAAAGADEGAGAGAGDAPGAGRISGGGGARISGGGGGGGGGGTLGAALSGLGAGLGAGVGAAGAALGLDASAGLEGDVPAEALSDPDSRFMDMACGVRLHYKVGRCRLTL